MEIGDEIVNVNDGEKAIVYCAGKYRIRVFNKKGFNYISNFDEWKKTGRRYADIDLLKHARSRYKHVRGFTIWPGDEVIYKNINGHEIYGVVTNVCEKHLVVKNYDGYGCVTNEASCVRTDYRFKIDDKILYFINMWQGDDQYIKEEKPMTNLEKYTKELDEVQEKLADLKKKIAAEPIEIGDEVTFDYGARKAIVTRKIEYEDERIYFNLIYPCDSGRSLTNYCVKFDRCTKTGRHFDGIDNIIKFLSES